MADSLAIIANGAKFQRGDGASPETFTDVPEVFEIIPGAPESPDIDVTHLGSSAGETRAGLPRFGTFTINMNALQGNSVQNAIEDEAGLNVTRNYRVMHPDAINGRRYSLTLATFVVTGYTVDGKLQATATYKQSGKPTRIP